MESNNKKIKLSLVLGVIMMVILTVGATYAYFGVTATNNGTTRNLNVRTDSLGTVALTRVTDEMHIITNAIDFAEDNTNTYYGTTNDNANYVGSEEEAVLYRLGATGGSNAATYKCTFTLSVTTTGLPASGMAGSGEYIVDLKGYTSGSTSNVLSLDMGTVSNRSVSKKVTMYITNSSPKVISASVRLININGNQNYLQGKNISTTFSTSNLSCELYNPSGNEQDSITTVATITYPSYYEFGTPTTTSSINPPNEKNVYVGLYDNNDLAVCITMDGTRYCFKSNNWDEEKDHVQEVFSGENDICESDITGNNDNDNVVCYNSDYYCQVTKRGVVLCGDINTNDSCRVMHNGSVICSTL